MRAESKASRNREGAEKTSLPHGRGSEEVETSFRINPLKAVVSFVPVVLLFLTALPEPLRLLHVPMTWLVDVEHFHGPNSELQAVFDSRLVGAAMLIGVVAAALTERRKFATRPGRSSRASATPSRILSR